MVQRAAGQKVPGVMIRHVPNCLGVIAEGVNTPGLLEAPELDGAVAGGGREQGSAVKCERNWVSWEIGTGNRSLLCPKPRWRGSEYATAAETERDARIGTVGM